MKKYCDSCKIKVAMWGYMPGKGDYCEDCVPRGCSCNRELTPENPDSIFQDYNHGTAPTGNFKWITPGLVWCPVDELGREYPCCEFSYYEEGIDIETEQ